MRSAAAQGDSASSRTTLVAPPPRIPAVGELVDGKYRVQRRIGRGAMGTVVVARHEILQKDVALKFVSTAATTPETLARFRKEARVLAAIESEHIARVLDAGQLENGAPFMALELLEGEDFEQLLQSRPRLPISDVVEWTIQALEGLAEAHALGIVHRDLKPANLFLTRRRDGTQVVKVLDFGVCKEDGGGSPSRSVPPLTVASEILGSPMYMAPEQLRDAKRVDARADIWAVGVVLYELLAGRPPFAADNMAHLMLVVLEGIPASLRKARPDVAPGLEAVVTRCLSRDVEARFPSVADLADALAPFGPDEAGASARRVRHVVQTAGRWNGRPAVKRTPRRVLPVAVAVVALGAATLASLAASGLFAGSGSAPIVAPTTQVHR